MTHHTTEIVIHLVSVISLLRFIHRRGPRCADRIDSEMCAREDGTKILDPKK